MDDVDCLVNTETIYLERVTCMLNHYPMFTYVIAISGLRVMYNIA